MKWSIAGVLTVLGALGLIAGAVGRLGDDLDRSRRTAEAERRLLQERNESLALQLRQSETDLQALRDDVSRLRADGDAARADQAQQIERRFDTVDRLGDAMAQRIDDYDRKLQDSSAAALAVRDEIASVRGALDDRRVDVGRLYNDLLHPSVQINARDAVGGGTLIHTRRLESGRSSAHILTAYHVIQKSIPGKGGKKDVIDPIEVRAYRQDGSVLGNFPADLISYSEARDIALLRIFVEEPIATLARLADRETLRALRVFTPVYAVGCPLGHDPIPSLGEISSLKKKVNGENFWMVNAPTIFGNSGGGIFHRETHEMIGISAMICTYDNLVSTPVPHLSIVVSMETVYDWLDEQGYGELYADAGKPASDVVQANY